MALCPPTGASLEGGGRYTPSALQMKVWGIWRDFWDVWVPAATKREPFSVVMNGDAVDGVHHNSTTQISHDLQDQANIAYELLAPIVDRCKGRFYLIRGTEAHVGQSGVNEEKLAQRLGAKKNEVNASSRLELRMNMGKHLIHFTHHIGGSNSMAYETTALTKELTEMLADSSKWRRQPPDMIVRSHRHRHCQTGTESANGGASGFVTAGWQLRTPFSYRIAGGRVALPQIGGSLVRLGADNVLFAMHKVHAIEPSPSVTP